MNKYLDDILGITAENVGDIWVILGKFCEDMCS